MAAKVPTLDDLMTLTREADDAKRSAELAEKEIGQAQRRAVKKNEALELARQALAAAKAGYEASLRK